MKDKKMGNVRHVSLNLSFMFLLKSHRQNYHPTPLTKRIGDGGWEGLSNNFFFELQKNWVLSINEKMLLKYLRLKFFWPVI